MATTLQEDKMIGVNVSVASRRFSRTFAVSWVMWPTFSKCRCSYWRKRSLASRSFCSVDCKSPSYGSNSVTRDARSVRT